MKKHLLSLIATAVAVAVLTPLAATLSAAQVTCRVPFSFVVNGKTMAPGTYSLETRDSVLIVSGINKTALALTNGAADRSNADPKLVFLKSGDRYDLLEVWTGGGQGRAVVMSPKYRQFLEDKARAANTTVERIVIAAM